MSIPGPISRRTLLRAGAAGAAILTGTEIAALHTDGS